MAAGGSFPLITVAGPTGSGKTALSLALAAQLDGEIVNFDSIQLYRGFDIGSAKPTPAERALAPHHLLDVLEPTEVSTAGGYASLARPILFDIGARGRVPILVGGTGFYLKAALEGLAPSPARDDSLRARLYGRERRRAGLLHRYLRRLDPATAARVHARDTNKLIRALEITLLSKSPASQWFAEQGRPALEGFRVLKIGLDPPRAELHQALRRRSQAMFDAGLLQEVRGLLKSGVPDTAKPFESLGYKEALQFLRGELTLEQAIEWTAIHTRQYAKRQWTWFRRDGETRWLSGFGHQSPVQEQALVIARSHVN